MKTRPVPSLLIGMAALLMAAAAATADPSQPAAAPPTQSTVLQLDEKASGTTSDMVVGQLFQVALVENASTGYRWEVQSEGAPACKLIDDVSEYTVAMPGAPGVRRFLFRVKEEGTGTITLAYRRPWETAPPIQTFTLTLQAKAPATELLSFAPPALVGDVDGDGKLTITDVVLLLKAVVGLR
jgi:predicted secreted protein